MKKILGFLSLLWKIYIAIIFGLTTLLFYPFITPLLFSEKTKKHSFKIFVFWSWIVRIFCFYPIKRLEKNPIPKEAPYIIVANHTSYLDIFLMYSIFPKHPFLFLGKNEILNYPLIKTYFKRLHISVDRKSRKGGIIAMKKSHEAIRNGWCLVIFPEGKIPWVAPKMSRLKVGAFSLAKEHKIPIIQMTYTNNHLLFSDPTDTFGPARPGISKIVIHPTLSTEYIEQKTASELKDEVAKTLEKPLKKAYPEVYQEENS